MQDRYGAQERMLEKLSQSQVSSTNSEEKKSNNYAEKTLGTY